MLRRPLVRAALRDPEHDAARSLRRSWKTSIKQAATHVSTAAFRVHKDVIGVVTAWSDHLEKFQPGA
jgi:hypothetical protein